MAETVAVERKLQVWFCEVCEAVSVIDYTDDPDVYSVIYQIEDNHREVSPDCQNGVYRIRLVIPTADWESEAPDWAHDRIRALLPS